MKTLTLLLTFCSSIFSSAAQVLNLVPNPNYEIYSTCPSAIGELQKATGWANVTGHQGTPDYFNVCTSNSIIDIPTNAFGFQNPSSGNGYIGLNMYYEAEPNFREYIQTRLTIPLVAGETYTISFKASLADKSKYSAPCFQFYFSNTPVSAFIGWFPITTVTPQVSSTTQITSKTAWTSVSINYTAMGGEEYLTMGNFRNDASTPGITTEAGPWTYASVYYYIDDYSLLPAVSLPVEFLTFKAECLGEGTELKWTTTSEKNSDFYSIESSLDGINYIKESTINVNQNSNLSTKYTYHSYEKTKRYFRLKQTDTIGNTTYSNVITSPCENKTVIFSPKIIINEGNISIDFNSSSEEIMTTSILDAIGNIKNTTSVYTSIGSNTISINTPLSYGIYLVFFSSTNHHFATKFINY